MEEAMSSTEQSAQNELVGGLAISQLVGEEDHDRDRGGAEETGLKRRLWVETKKLWHLVGPTILSRICAATLAVVTQAFAGHLGDVELASISIVNTVILGFSFGLVTGMSSALDTLCGQAFGAKRYHMLGIHLQRSCIVLFLCCCLLLPIYIFTTPILKLLGQPHDVAVQSGLVAVWSIPQHMSFAFVLPAFKFLQAQLKPWVFAWVSMGTLGVHVAISWLFMYKFRLGVVGIAVAMDLSWWIMVGGMFGYVLCGGCPETWTGFSVKAFSGLWDFFKLSAASGVMICLENWYYRILVLMTGHLKNSTLALDALLVCMNVNAWEMMIPISFFAAIGGEQSKSCERARSRKWKGSKICNKGVRGSIPLNWHTLLSPHYTLPSQACDDLLIQSRCHPSSWQAFLPLGLDHPFQQCSTHFIWGSRGFWLAIMGGLYKYRLLLPYWNPRGTFSWEILPLWCSGYLGWYDFWHGCANNNIGHHNNIVRLGERGTKSCSAGEAFVES